MRSKDWGIRGTIGVWEGRRRGYGRDVEESTLAVKYLEGEEKEGKTARKERKDVYGRRIKRQERNHE